MMERHALALLRNGYSPVPIEPNHQRPLAALGLGWERLRTTPLTPDEIAQIYAGHPDAGLGVAGGFNRLAPIDVDTEVTEIVAAVQAILPVPLVAKRGRRGSTGFCRDPSGLITGRKFKTPDNKMLVEVLVTGQTVVPPSIHPKTGKPYVWLTERTLLDVRVDELPELPPDIIERLEVALRPWLPARTYVRPKVTAARPVVSDGRMRKYAEAALDGEVQALRSTPEGGRNPQLFNAICRLGKYVHHGVLTEEEVRSALLGAAEINGLISDDGLKACNDTISSGLRKAEFDELPILENRGTNVNRQSSPMARGEGPRRGSGGSYWDRKPGRGYRIPVQAERPAHIIQVAASRQVHVVRPERRAACVVQPRVHRKFIVQP
jgi:hypothetical protein